MKFIMEGLLLSDAAFAVSKACSSKTINPILECIKITAKNDEISLLAYDGEFSIEKKIKGDIIEEGEACVNGKFFADFIGKITHLNITLVTNEKGMEIRYENSKSFMSILPAEDFPVIKKEDTARFFEVKEKDFKELVAKTVFCCASDEARPILKGCLLETEEGRLNATALDGFRMAVSSCEIVGGENVKIVVPARTLSEISRMLEGDEKILKIYFSRNNVSIELENTTIISRLYLGEFINKANIFPPQFTTETYVLKDELLSSAERASVLIRGDKNNLILMEIHPSSIFITANSDLGNVAETVKCDLEGKELKIAMNVKYLIDALKAVEGPTVKLSFNTPVSPFTVTNEEKKESAYLILPVRTGA